MKKRLATWLKHWQKVVTPTAWLVAIALSIVGLLRLNPTGDLTDLLPDRDPVVNQYQQLSQRFSLMRTVFADVGLAADEPLNRETRQAMFDAAQAFEQQLEQSGTFERVLGRMSATQGLALLQFMQEHQAIYFDADEAQRLQTQATDPDAIDAAVEQTYRQLLSPAGTLTVEALQRDPLGWSEHWRQKAKSLAPTNAKVQLEQGRLVSTNGRRVLVLAVPRDSGANEAVAEQVQQAMRQARQAARAAAGNIAIQIRSTSVHRSTLDNAATIRRDVMRISIVTLIALVAVTLTMFVRPWLILLAFVPAGVGLLAAFGLFGFIDPQVPAVVLGFGGALVAIAIDMGIHVVNQWQHAANAPTPHRWMPWVRRPLILAGLTTAAAMLCLLSSALPGKRQLGVFAATGVLTALLAALTLLPWLLHQLPQRKAQSHPLFTRLVQACAARLARHRLLWAGAALLGLALALPGLSRLHFDANPAKLSALSEQVRQDEQGLYETWGSLRITFIMVNGPSPEAVLREAAAVTDVLRKLSRQGDIESFTSITQLLPSPDEQRRNLDRWRRFWTPQRLEAFKQHIAAAARRRGLKPQAFAPFFKQLATSSSTEPVTLDALRECNLDWFTAGRIASTSNAVSLLITVTPSEHFPIAKLKAALPEAEAGASIAVLNRQSLVRHLVLMIQDELWQLSLLAAVVVLVVLGLVYAQVALVLLAFLPVAAAMATTLGLMGWLGVDVNLFNAIFVVFVFGIGIDYSVFLTSSMVSHYRTGKTESQALPAVSACMVTTLCGLGALTLAVHPALRSVGLTACIGVGTSYVGSLAVLALLGRCFLPKRDTEPPIPAPGFKQVLGGVWVWGYLGIGSGLYALVRWPLLYLVYHGDRDRLASFARRWLHHMARILIRTFFYRRSQVRYAGLENTDWDRPAVLTANHLAGFDIMCLLSLPCEMVMVVKKWVWDAPGMGRLVQDAQFILGEGEGSSTQVLEQGKRHLAAGRMVTIFAEGTRSRDACVHRFRSGAFELAIQADADVLPVRLTGSQWCTPRGRMDIGEFDVIVRVLPRITMDDNTKAQGRLALARTIRQQVEAGFNADDRTTQLGPSVWQRAMALYRYQGPYVETYLRCKLRFDPIYRELDALVPTAATVVDAGCGYGLACNVLSLQSRGRRVLGVDRDQDKLAIARRAGRFVPAVQYLCADLRHWPVQQADVVLLIDVLHYWTASQQQQLIQTAAASVRPGGRLIFRDNYRQEQGPSLGARSGEMYSLVIGHNLRGEGLFFMPQSTYVQWFETAGLRLKTQWTQDNGELDRVMVFHRPAQPATAGDST